MEKYLVKKVTGSLDIRVEGPGSKSITNRALLMAAMAEGKSELQGVLFSDDSENFLQSLKQLGFSIEIDRDKKRVCIDGHGGSIPKKEAKIYVGSAGTAARFLTAYLAMGDGRYEIEASEQMKKRPMRELLEALEMLGAKIQYLEEAYSFPMVIEGIKGHKAIAEIELNIDRSSQFLSALLMVAPLRFDELLIRLTGTRNARSYVEMTEQMMKQFHHPGVQQLDKNCYRIGKGEYEAVSYRIEPDVSAACYFYAMAAVTGGQAVVEHMRRDSLQGDMRFLVVLEKMGCQVEWTEAGDLLLTGPRAGKLKGFDLSFSDFSDQALTAAAIAPYAQNPVTIRGIAHTRGQESDRIAVICQELGRLGVRCQELADGVTIFPGEMHGATVHTYEDHRVAMAFAITGLRTEGVEIENPQCCKKTFPEFFTIFDKILNK